MGVSGNHLYVVNIPCLVFIGGCFMICHKFICVCHAPKKRSTIVSSILRIIPFESTKNITAPATWANGHGCHAFFCKFRWDMFSITSHIDMFNRTHNKTNQDLSQIGTFMNLPRPGRKVKCVTYSPTHGSFSYYMEGILELRIVSSLSS